MKSLRTVILSAFLLFLHLSVHSQTYCTDCDMCSKPATEANPVLNATCQGNLKLTLVIDESNSIGEEGATAMASLKNGVMAFLQDLSCTNVQVAAVEFNDLARNVIGSHQPVAGIQSCMENYFDGISCNGQTYDPAGSTNWQAALLNVKDIGVADLVVFFTDGKPTSFLPDVTDRTNYEYCGAATGGSTTDPADINNAITAANKLKSLGSRIFVLGVGDNVDLGQIQDISGPTEFTNNIALADYALVDDFTDLEQAWQNLSDNLCPLMIECTQEPSCTSVVVTIDVSDQAVGPFTVSYGAESFVTPTEPIELTISTSGDYLIQVDDMSDCNLHDTCHIAVEIKDDLPPTIESCPDQILPCITDHFPTVADLPLPFTSAVQLTASDDITAPEDLTLSVTHQGPHPLDDCTLEFIRTYTVTDQCGNTAECVQGFTISHDNEDPLLENAPADQEFSCLDEVPAAPTLLATDNCFGEKRIRPIEETIQHRCGYDIVRTYSVADDCGNKVVKSYRIMVRDNEAPSLTVPDDLVVECGTEIPAPTFEAYDNCGEPTVEFNEERIDQGNCECDLIRTWTAKDQCGHEVSKQQIINVMDNTAPSIRPTHPMLAGVPNGGEIILYDGCHSPQMTTNDVVATDACCGQLLPNFSEQVLGLNLCGTFSHTRHYRCTYSAEDASGNTTEFSFDVIMYDTSAPVIQNVPEDISLPCNALLPQAPSDVQAVDDCTVREEVFTSSIVANPENPAQSAMVRTWAASDACGNSTTKSQIIGLCDLAPERVSSGLQSNIWIDTNRDGIQQENEDGLNNVLVQLYYQSALSEEMIWADSIRSRSSRNIEGYFEFPHLIPGTYQIGFSVVSGMQATLFQMDPDGKNDNDVLPDVMTTELFQIDSGMLVKDIAAGFYFQEETDEEDEKEEQGQFQHTSDRNHDQRQAENTSSPNPSPANGSVNMSAGNMQCYPNPTTSHVNVHFESSSDGVGRLLLTDQLGRQLLAKHIQVSSGENVQKIDMLNLSAGLYFISIETDDSVSTDRIMKK